MTSFLIGLVVYTITKVIGDLLGLGRGTILVISLLISYALIGLTWGL